MVKPKRKRLEFLIDGTSHLAKGAFVHAKLHFEPGSHGRLLWDEIEVRPQTWRLACLFYDEELGYSYDELVLTLRRWNKKYGERDAYLCMRCARRLRLLW